MTNQNIFMAALAVVFHSLIVIAFSSYYLVEKDKDRYKLCHDKLLKGKKQLSKVKTFFVVAKFYYYKEQNMNKNQHHVLTRHWKVKVFLDEVENLKFLIKQKGGGTSTRNACMSGTILLNCMCMSVFVCMCSVWVCLYVCVQKILKYFLSKKKKKLNKQKRK